MRASHRQANAVVPDPVPATEHGAVPFQKGNAMSRFRTTTCLGASLLALTAAAAVHAQSVPASDEAPEADIVVTGQRASQARALATKRDAIGVIDVAAADDIGRLPDRNVAEVIEHLPGVGVTYDQGEGRYASVRGVPSTLNGYTLNGLEIGRASCRERVYSGV